jgi:hypothetical protein
VGAEVRAVGMRNFYCRILGRGRVGGLWAEIFSPLGVGCRTKLLIADF